MRAFDLEHLATLRRYVRRPRRSVDRAPDGFGANVESLTVDPDLFNANALRPGETLHELVARCRHRRNSWVFPEDR